jgi:lysophospholipase L1-like esterase/acetyl esterase/lipase
MNATPGAMAMKRMMKLSLLAGICSLLAVARVLAADPSSAEWFSLQGTPAVSGNAPDDQGLVRKFDAAVLGVTQTTQPDSLGTVLLLPGGGYNILDVLNEGVRTAATLNNFGYDVAMLEYHVGAGVKSRALALEDALAAWRLLKQKPEALRLKRGRGIVMGYSAGGHLAARLVQELPEGEQPDDIVLVYPAYLEEKPGNTDLPAVQPPAHPHSRLIAMMAADDRATWLTGCREYVNAWRKVGGEGLMFQFKNGGHGFGMKPDLTGDLAQWPNILKYFLENGPKPGVGPFNMVLPWFLPNLEGRLAKFKADQAADQGAVVFLGDSITAKWKLEQAFSEYKIANRGISGDTTRGMFCRLEDNVLALHPKAIVFLGGINDLFGGGTPEDIAANVRSILELARKAGDMPIFVCEVLPCKGRPSEMLTATNVALAKVVGDFANVHLVPTYAPLLKPDGTQDETLFLDGTHPNESGYAVMQKTISAELAKYVRGDL